MAQTVTNTLTDTFKRELLFGTHCFAAPVSFTCSAVSGAILTVNTVAGMVIGMAASGTNILANSFIISMTTTTITLNQAPSSLPTGTCTATGDVFKILLLKSGSYLDGTLKRVGTPGTGTPTTTNVGTDELTSANGYTTGGLALTNVGLPAEPPGATAYTSFLYSGAQPFWTFTNGVTMTPVGAVIYNTSTHMEGVGGRTVAIFDILSASGGQPVTNGTLTLQLPTNGSTSSIVRIS